MPSLSTKLKTHFALNDSKLHREVFAGLTVAMTMIPESLSFAILAGFSPLSGLYAAFIMGIVTAVFGGRPGLISGGAGATVIVLIALMQSHGFEYVLCAIFLSGVIQILVGLFKLGKFIRLVPQSVMYGFVNGLAVVIFMSQFQQFKFWNGTSFELLPQQQFLSMLGLVLLSMLIIYVLPKITKALPASLISIVLVCLVVYGFGIDTKSIKDIADISGSLPHFSLPNIPFTWDTLLIVLPYAGIMAGVALTETLLTLNLVDEITDSNGNGNQECIAQGGANMLNGVFGGMGGCAMIAQTFVNLEAGARSRISGIIGALTILLIILVASPLIERIPMAALTGIMFTVAISTFSWSSLKIFKKMPNSDVFVAVIVAIITIFMHNLALAVLVGVLISALVFAWNSSKKIRARQIVNADGSKTYQLYGPLYFASCPVFYEKFDVKGDPQKIFIDFAESRILDLSALEMLGKLNKKYLQHNKEITLINLSSDSKRLLNNAKDLLHLNY